MDTSEQYIKMCEKVVGVQHEWEPRAGDWAFYYDVCGFSNVHCITSAMLSPYCEDEHILFNDVMGNTKQWHESGEFDGLTGVYVWLPRQDQLQEMMPQKGMVAQYIRLHQLCWDMDSGDSFLSNVTWEQLWLCVVMHEKYNKVWNGEDWVDAKEKEA